MTEKKQYFKSKCVWDSQKQTGGEYHDIIQRNTLEGVDCMDLTENRNHRWALVNTSKSRKFFDHLTLISMLKEGLFLEIFCQSVKSSVINLHFQNQLTPSAFKHPQNTSSSGQFASAFFIFFYSKCMSRGKSNIQRQF